MSYFVFYCYICLYVSCGGLVTSVGEERAMFSAIVYLLLCNFCSERFPFSSWCFGSAALFYHDTPLKFHVIIW